MGCVHAKGGAVRTNRTPFYGMPEDRDILPAELRFAVDEMAAIAPEALDMIGHMGDGSDESVAQNVIPGAVKPLHPDYREKGTELALGFHQHQGENRKTRRAAVANWQPPKITQTVEAGNGAGAPSPEDASKTGEESRPAGVTPAAPAPMPTRRELWLQRKKHRRGKLDVETRRLQHERLKQK